MINLNDIKKELELLDCYHDDLMRILQVKTLFPEQIYMRAKHALVVLDDKRHKLQYELNYEEIKRRVDKLHQIENYLNIVNEQC